MFCVNCGKELPDDSVFCANCGTKIVTDNKIESINSKKTNQKVNQKKNNKTAKLYIVILAVILFGGVSALITNEFYLEKNNKNSSFSEQGLNDELPERAENNIILGTWYGESDTGDGSLYKYNEDGTYIYLSLKYMAYLEGYYEIVLDQEGSSSKMLINKYSGSDKITDELLEYEDGIGLKNKDGQIRYSKINNDEFDDYLKMSICVLPLDEATYIPAPYVDTNENTQSGQTLDEESQNDVVEDLLSYNNTNTSETSEVKDSGEITDKEQFLKYIGTNISEIIEVFGEPLSKWNQDGGDVFEYGDIAFVFGGVEQINPNVNVLGLCLFDGDEIFNVNVGMTNKEISGILGLPTYSGYSDMDGNYYYSVYSFDDYELSFRAEHKDEGTYFLLVSISDEEVINDDECMLKDLEQAVDYFVESYDINLREQDVSQNNEAVIDGVKYYSVTVVSLSGRGAAMTYYINSTDGTILNEIDAPDSLISEFWN